MRNNQPLHAARILPRKFHQFLKFPNVIGESGLHWGTIASGRDLQKTPHPNPLPEYWEREQK
jgi:hypothetical protein